MHKLESEGLSAGSRSVRLGDVVENVNDYFHKGSGGAIRYVAGEHIDEGNLKVRRSGMTSDDLVPPTFNRLFKAGDVLFHSRNIRKLAQPDFDGLTGEKLFVLRTKNPRLLSQAFLPFLLQSERFRNYVEERWAGSTNKFLNKTPLMAYEFALPPMEEQERAIRVLEAAADSLEALEQASLAATALLQAVIDAGSGGSDGTEASLQAVCARPITYGIVQAGPHVDSGVPYIRVSDMTASEKLSIRGMLRTSPEIAERFKRSSVSSGDIVIALRGAVGLCRVVPEELHGANLTQGTARISISDDTVSTFVYWALRSTPVRRQIEQVSKGSTFREITLASLREIKLRIPSAAEMSAFNARVAELAAGVAAFRARAMEARLLSARVRRAALGA